MRHLVFITLLLLASASLSSEAQSLDLPEQDKGELLIAKEYIHFGLSGTHKLYISSGEDYLKEIELEDIENNNAGSNLKNLTGILNKIKNKDYQLLNTSTRGGAGGFYFMYFIFQKE